MEFIGVIKIEDLEPEGYTVEFYLDNDYYPLTISADLPDEEFLKFIKQELLDRGLHKTQYCKAIRLYDNKHICK